MKDQMLSAIILVISIVLLCGCAEYYHPFGQLVSELGITVKPSYATWAGIIGFAGLLIHQRDESPIAKA